MYKLKQSAMVLTVGLLGLICTYNITYAQEINLSSLSAGNIASHSHILVKKFDSSYHWKECSICKLQEDRQEHDISVRYTIAENSCNKDNYKVSSCLCGFEESEQHVNLNHVPRGVFQMPGYFWTVCNVCGIDYYNSERGDIYTYLNGSIVDCNDLKLPNTIVDQDGNRQYFSHIFKKLVCDRDMYNINCIISEDYRKANIEGYVILPDDILSQLTDAMIVNPNYISTYISVYKLSSGAEEGSSSYTITEKSFDRDTKRLYFYISIPIKDYKMDYLNVGLYSVAASCILPSGIYNYETGPIELKVNFMEPSISSIGY